MKILTKSLIIIALVAMLISSITGCGGTKEGMKTPEPGRLEILSHSMRIDSSGNAVVKGKAENVGSTTIGFGRITVEFYDASGTLLDTETDVKSNLAAGATWSFKLTYTEGQNVDSYEIKGEGYGPRR